MLLRMNIGEFIGTLVSTIESRTGIKCTTNPDNEPSPFYAVELIKAEPTDTKMYFIDRYDFWIHCISEPVEPYSDGPVLDLVTALEEAMTEDLVLSEPFNMYRQEFTGMQTLKRDESGEGHAILNYSFFICYGYKVK